MPKTSKKAHLDRIFKVALLSSRKPDNRGYMTSISYQKLHQRRRKYKKGFRSAGIMQIIIRGLE
jgi:hypothetical protein